MAGELCRRHRGAVHCHGLAVLGQYGVGAELLVHRLHDLRDIAAQAGRLKLRRQRQVAVSGDEAVRVSHIALVVGVLRHQHCLPAHLFHDRLLECRRHPLEIGVGQSLLALLDHVVDRRDAGIRCQLLVGRGGGQVAGRLPIQQLLLPLALTLAAFAQQALLLEHVVQCGALTARVCHEVDSHNPASLYRSHDHATTCATLSGRSRAVVHEAQAEGIHVHGDGAALHRELHRADARKIAVPDVT